jgi:hypothetical protein
MGPEENDVHFMFGVISKPIFSEESDGAGHFLKNGAQHAHFGPILCPLVGPNKKPCHLPEKNI